MIKEEINAQKAYIFAILTSQRTDRSLGKELAKSMQEKIIFKKFPYSSKNKNRHTQPDRQ